ncbi:MAG: type I restriction-modification system subunit M [Reyranella sp.]|jgi:type I restriction enzyme M protein|nr:type I restriction-modification system subunit M [Reyranella sp.]
MNAQTLVSKVWNYAHVLRDDGVAYGEYVSQISYLLMLKMDEERVENLNQPSDLPADCRWSVLRDLTGEALDARYKAILAKLSRQDGFIGAVFLKAESQINDPAKLRRLVSLIDSETWLGIGVDVKGSLYEGLLERNAGEVKSGAGQYFTPRPLIQAIVEAVDPSPGQTVGDPACGTGGFLIAAYEHMKGKPGARDRRMQERLRDGTFFGLDIVPDVVRLCAMNLYLHGIGGKTSPVTQADALLKDTGLRVDVVLANPPFGRKQSFRIVNEEGGIETERQDYYRQDFTVTTSNKQLNFLQHIMNMLKPGGTAAVVLPDNVLFEGGGGERLREKLLKNFDLHTVLRLPTGIFYKQGVKANVLFFDKPAGAAAHGSDQVWFYDLRTNKSFTLRERPLVRADLDDFVACFKTGKRHKRVASERFRSFGAQELLARDKVNLDLFWLKDANADDPDSLPPPDEIAEEIVENLETALAKFRRVAAELAKLRAVD